MDDWVLCLLNKLKGDFFLQRPLITVLVYNADNSESPTLSRVLPETLFFHLKTYFLFLFIYHELDSNILVKYTGKFPEFYILGSISTYPHPSKHFFAFGP